MNQYNTVKIDHHLNIMSQLENTVFICYRRANAFNALAVYQDLTQNGYDVFMDYQNIDAGDFEHIIMENIKGRAHFIVILTPSALERCNQKADWLRREIEYALEHKRNIVPLIFEGFDYESPAIKPHLTGKLALLTRYQAQRVPADFFDAAMDKVRNRFLSKPVDTIIHPLSSDARRIVEQQQNLAGSQETVTEESLTAEGYFEQALALPDTDLDGKIEYYSRAIGLRSDYPDAYNNRGIAYANKGRKKRAVADYCEAIRIKPDYADAYYNRGNILLENGHYSHALKDFGRAIKRKADYADAYLGAGLAHFNILDYTMAIALYTRALQFDPNSAKTYLNRGNAYFEKGKYPAAIRDYTHSIKLKNPELHVVYNNRGLAYYEYGLSDRALADFETALRLNPDDQHAQINLDMLQQST